MKLNVKKKMSAAVDHVKSHPAMYGALAGIALVTTARFVYDTKKGMVSLNDVVKDMTDTGKGVYFRNTKTGVTVILAMYNPETMSDIKFLD